MRSIRSSEARSLRDPPEAVLQLVSMVLGREGGPGAQACPDGPRVVHTFCTNQEQRQVMGRRPQLWGRRTG